MTDLARITQMNITDKRRSTSYRTTNVDIDNLPTERKAVDMYYVSFGSSSYAQTTVVQTSKFI